MEMQFLALRGSRIRKRFESLQCHPPLHFPTPYSLHYIGDCVTIIVIISVIRWFNNWFYDWFNNCLGRPYHFNFFKACLPQILLGPFLNTLTHLPTTGILNPKGLTFVGKIPANIDFVLTSKQYAGQLKYSYFQHRHCKVQHFYKTKNFRNH